MLWVAKYKQVYSIVEKVGFDNYYFWKNEF